MTVHSPVSKSPFTPTRITSVFVCQEKLLAAGISSLLEKTSDLDMVAEFSEGANLLPQIEHYQPHLVLLDADYRSQDPFVLAGEIKKNMPMTKVVFLMRKVTDIKILRALQAGSMGIFLTSASREEFLEGMRRIALGDRRFSPQVVAKLRFDPVTDDVNSLNGNNKLSVLTPRQLEVLRYLAYGNSVKHVAKLMHLSEKSVDSHKYRIMNRLGIHDRVKLALYAIREGLIEP